MSLPASLEKQIKNSFGFDPARSEHHFVVLLPANASQNVLISEHIKWSEAVGSSTPHNSPRRLDGQSRVEISRDKWNRVADEARVVFNARLRKEGLTAGGWIGGNNLLRRELGRELCVLAWAIEKAELSKTEQAINNWKGLTPEERWWLYTQTAAATAGQFDGDLGWRVALRYAIAEGREQKIENSYEDVRSEYADTPARAPSAPPIPPSPPVVYERVNAAQKTLLEPAEPTPQLLAQPDQASTNPSDEPKPSSKKRGKKNA